MYKQFVNWRVLCEQFELKPLDLFRILGLEREDGSVVAVWVITRQGRLFESLDGQRWEELEDGLAAVQGLTAPITA
jgi:hypothetical protein